MERQSNFSECELLESNMINWKEMEDIEKGYEGGRWEAYIYGGTINLS